MMRFFEPACLFLREMLAHEVLQRLAVAFGEQHGAAHRIPAGWRAGCVESATLISPGAMQVYYGHDNILRECLN